MRRRLGRLPELPSDEGKRLGPLALVAIAVGFNLYVLRAEILPVLYLNDSSVHLSMVRWAVARMQEGHLPFDGWYPYLGLGSSLFHHYQSLPHTLTGTLGLAIGADRAYAGTLYVLLATWPISVYLGARWLGWERWAAGAAALVSPLVLSTPGYGYEHGSYTWRGLGVWSQEWAMWLLPLALGLSWRAVSRSTPTRYAVAALVVGLTAACHFLTGYLAFLAIGVWVLIRPSELWKRIGRAALVGFGALLIISWVVVPLLLDSRWTSQSRYLKGTFWFDSFGARKVLAWLFTGQLFDGTRTIPVISVLVAVGAGVCIARFRRDERARALLGLLALSLLLFFGRPTLGPLLKLLPGSDDLLLHRYIMGVHLAGIMLAGVGGAWLGLAAVRGVRRLGSQRGACGEDGRSRRGLLRRPRARGGGAVGVRPEGRRLGPTPADDRRNRRRRHPLAGRGGQGPRARSDLRRAVGRLGRELPAVGGAGVLGPARLRCRQRRVRASDDIALV